MALTPRSSTERLPCGRIAPLAGCIYFWHHPPIDTFTQLYSHGAAASPLREGATVRNADRISSPSLGKTRSDLLSVS